jgi:light-harvesting complex I chlorophyll a/b binding protein 1
MCISGLAGPVQSSACAIASTIPGARQLWRVPWARAVIFYFLEASRSPFRSDTRHPVHSAKMQLLLTASLALTSPQMPATSRATVTTRSALASRATVTMKSSALDGSMVGDYGFDPLGLAATDLNLGSANEKDRSAAYVLRDYREAELRHGRLAMLAAIAWPVQELVNPVLSRALREPDFLSQLGGMSPSVLNGGLGLGPIPFTVAAFAVLIAAVDLKSIELKGEVGEDWLPGDFGFDPLNILGGADIAAKRDMQLKELNNGRLAMLAVTVFVIEEFLTKTSVVALNPLLFRPIYEYVGFQQFMDGAFSIASMRCAFSWTCAISLGRASCAVASDKLSLTAVGGLRY